MMAKSNQSFTKIETMAAASIIHGMGPQKNLPNMARGLTFFSFYCVSSVLRQASLGFGAREADF